MNQLEIEETECYQGQYEQHIEYEAGNQPSNEHQHEENVQQAQNIPAGVIQSQQSEQNVQDTNQNPEETHSAEDELQQEQEQSAKNLQTSELQYKYVSTALQKKYKKLIEERATAETSFIMLTKENDLMDQRINEKRKEIEHLEIENEKLNVQVTQSNQEVSQLHQEIVNFGETNDKLTAFVDSLKIEVKNDKERHQELYNTILQQKEKFDKFRETKTKILNDLRRELDDVKKSGDADAADAARKENLRLKKLIAEKRERLNQANKLDDEKTKQMSNVKEEAMKLEQELKEKQKKLRELRASTDIAIAESNKRINSLNETHEKKIQRTADLTQEVTKAEHRLKEYNIRREIFQKDREQSNQIISDLKAKLEVLDKESLAAKRKNYNEMLERHQTEVNNLNGQLENLEAELNNLKEQNKSQSQSTEQLITRYSDMMEEKNNLTSQIFELNEAVSADNTARSRLRELEDKINKKEQKINNMKAAMDDISQNPAVVSLQRKKEFVVACANLLSEQTESVNEKNEALRSTRKNLIEEVENLKLAVNEKKEELEKRALKKSKTINKHRSRSLPRELATKVKNAASDTTPLGILKKSNTTAKDPISPKRKVKFENFSSTSNSSQADGDNFVSDFVKKLLQGQSKPPQPIIKKRRVFD